MKWTRQSAPATVAQLRTNAEPIRTERADLAAELAEIQGALADLAGDPSAFTAAQARLRDIQALLPIKDAALAAIEAAIPAAEKREKVAAVEAEIAEQERRTVKLCRTLEARYTAAAQAYADVLREMDENERAWDRLNDRASDVGLQGGNQPAEWRLRKQFASTASRLLGTTSLHWRALVLGWNGQPLFRGSQHEYRKDA